mmetsp:Transcript_10174/g.46589  ORF Transcript_10174/g.46589 Transcript_10174/m.46589 type:complete len:383 (-) Transcript_10174:30-1178(-)
MIRGRSSSSDRSRSTSRAEASSARSASLLPFDASVSCVFRASSASTSSSSASATARSRFDTLSSRSATASCRSMALSSCARTFLSFSSSCATLRSEASPVASGELFTAVSAPSAPEVASVARSSANSFTVAARSRSASTARFSASLRFLSAAAARILATDSVRVICGPSLDETSAGEDEARVVPSPPSSPSPSLPELAFGVAYVASTFVVCIASVPPGELLISCRMDCTIASIAVRTASTTFGSSACRITSRCASFAATTKPRDRVDARVQLPMDWYGKLPSVPFLPSRRTPRRDTSTATVASFLPSRSWMRRPAKVRTCDIVPGGSLDSPRVSGTLRGAVEWMPAGLPRRAGCPEPVGSRLDRTLVTIRPRRFDISRVRRL